MYVRVLCLLSVRCFVFLFQTSDSESPFYTYFNKLINRGFQDDDGGDLQLVSIQTGLATSHDDYPSDNNMTYDDEDEDENITSGDLMAFAWQVSQGMVRKIMLNVIKLRINLQNTFLL